MSHKMRVSFGVVVLLVFGTMAFLNFNKTVAPYVPFAEAKTASRAVQVAGFPDHARARFDPQSKLFQFTLTDEQGEVMPVVFAGAKPGNFDQAEKVVVIGKYESGTFHANQILVKCPSKYDDLAADKLEGAKTPEKTY